MPHSSIIYSTPVSNYCLSVSNENKNFPSRSCIYCRKQFMCILLDIDCILRQTCKNGIIHERGSFCRIWKEAHEYAIIYPLLLRKYITPNYVIVVSQEILWKKSLQKLIVWHFRKCFYFKFICMFHSLYQSLLGTFLLYFSIAHTFPFLPRAAGRFESFYHGTIVDDSWCIVRNLAIYAQLATTVFNLYWSWLPASFH